MISVPLGTRVIAIACVDPVAMTVEFYGNGFYAGEFSRPGYEGVPVEGSDEYEDWAAVIRRSDEQNLSLQWSLDAHLADLQAGEIDQAEYELRCTYAEQAEARERARSMPDRVASAYEGIVRNPRIDLDEGGSVWGFECWWGPEKEVSDRYEDWTWIRRSIEEDRLKADQP